MSDVWGGIYRDLSDKINAQVIHCYHVTWGPFHCCFLFHLPVSLSPSIHFSSQPSWTWPGLFSQSLHGRCRAMDWICISQTLASRVPPSETAHHFIFHWLLCVCKLMILNRNSSSERQTIQVIVTYAGEECISLTHGSIDAIAGCCLWLIIWDPGIFQFVASLSWSKVGTQALARRCLYPGRREERGQGEGNTLFLAGHLLCSDHTTFSDICLAYQLFDHL